MVAEDLAGLFEGPPEGATPEGEAEAGPEMASPEAGGEDPFAFLYETYLPGGPGALQGGTGEALIYLEAGDYAVLALGFSPPVAMTVTEGEEVSVAATPVSAVITVDATITETGTSGTFDFAFSDGAFAGGPAVLEIFNDSDQPHFIFAIRSENPITEDEVMALLMEEEGGEGAEAGGTPVTDEGAEGATPATGGPPASIAPAFITGTQSPGTTQYVGVDLEPGYYILLCFVGDPQQGGIPHSFEGMIEIVPIGV
jgi:hypothetical protein